MNDSPQPRQTFVQLLTHLPLDEQSPTDLFDAAETRLQSLRHSLEAFAVANDPDLPPAATLNGLFTAMALLASDVERMYAYASPRRTSAKPEQRNE